MSASVGVDGGAIMDALALVAFISSLTGRPGLYGHVVTAELGGRNREILHSVPPTLSLEMHLPMCLVT